jgi:hypothetical protein
MERHSTDHGYEERILDAQTAAAEPSDVHPPEHVPAFMPHPHPLDARLIAAAFERAGIQLTGDDLRKAARDGGVSTQAHNALVLLSDLLDAAEPTPVEADALAAARAYGESTGLLRPAPKVFHVEIIDLDEPDDQLEVIYDVPASSREHACENAAVTAAVKAHRDGDYPNAGIGRVLPAGAAA